MPKEKLEIGCKAKKKTTGRLTGAWRTFRPIITEKCTGCAKCVEVCPEGCIKLRYSTKNKTKKKADVDYDYCKGCLICMSICPFKAIEKEMEK